MFGVMGFIGGLVTAQPWEIGWAVGIMTGAEAAGAQYTFEKAVNSGNIAAIAGVFIGGPGIPDYSGIGGAINTGGIYGSGSAGPFIFSFEKQTEKFWTTDYNGAPVWVPRVVGTSTEAKITAAPRPSNISVAGSCAVAALKDHLFGITAATAAGPLPKKLLGEAVAGGEGGASRFTSLFSKIGIYKDWRMSAPMLGRIGTSTRTIWLMRGVGRAVAPAALIINFGEGIKTYQDASTCYSISR